MWAYCVHHFDSPLSSVSPSTPRHTAIKCGCSGLSSKDWGPWKDKWNKMNRNHVFFLQQPLLSKALYLSVRSCGGFLYSCWHADWCSIWRSCAGSHVVGGSWQPHLGPVQNAQHQTADRQVLGVLHPFHSRFCSGSWASDVRIVLWMSLQYLGSPISQAQLKNAMGHSRFYYICRKILSTKEYEKVILIIRKWWNDRVPWKTSLKICTIENLDESVSYWPVQLKVMKNTSLLHKRLSALSMRRVVFRLGFHCPVWMSQPIVTQRWLDLQPHLCTIVVPPNPHCPLQLVTYNLNLTKIQTDIHVTQLLPFVANVRRSQITRVL